MRDLPLDSISGAVRCCSFRILFSGEPGAVWAQPESSAGIRANQALATIRPIAISIQPRFYSAQMHRPESAEVPKNVRSCANLARIITIGPFCEESGDAVANTNGAARHLCATVAPAETFAAMRKLRQNVAA